MSEHVKTRPDKPYKFLDPYDVEDAAIFFGRDRESRVLFSDVIVNRLVVLFAPSGTGKTSLINAGVRPRLHQRGYETFFVRVREDPVASALVELRQRDALSSQTGDSFARQLQHAVERLKRPIVLFFDQFEEFFIYVMRPKPDAGRQFIEDVSQLYRNRDSGVHLVFSMREEFFVEMDAFRDSIPTIFHNESNLRLRPFNREQAREAIVQPARVFETELEPALVERLITDLSDPVTGVPDADAASIEPAQLQIVCDTLWKETAARQPTDRRRITIGQYNNLGRRGSTDTIAVQVLYRRLEEMFQNLESQTQLPLLYALLPKLRTPWKTKYVRDIIGVVNELTVNDACLRDIIRDEVRLRELVEQLNSDNPPLRDVINQLVGFGLLRRGLRDKLEVIELSHDYLVGALESLQERVKGIILRRSLRNAMDAAQKQREVASEETRKLIDRGLIPGEDHYESLTETERDALFMSRPDFEALSDGAALLGTLAEEEARFLFDAALEHGVELRGWFERADESTVDVWKVLRELVDRPAGRTEQVRNALQLLGDIRGRRAVQLLESALHRAELAPAALEVLGKSKSSEVMDLLEKKLWDKGLADKVIDVLRRMRTPESISLLATAAGRGGQLALQALYKVAFSRQDDVSDAARKAWVKMMQAEKTKGMTSETQKARSRVYKFGDSQLTLAFSDITTSEAQVLVSSDDIGLTGGGGVSAAIRRAGGNAILLDAAKKVPVPLGKVAVTTAGTLPAHHIFHAATIGPSPTPMSPTEILRSVTRQSLELLDALQLRSIAFPALGAGTAKFSYEEVAARMAEVIAGSLLNRQRPIDVTIHLFDDSGRKQPFDYIRFFEEFAARVPRVAAHKASAQASTTEADAVREHVFISYSHQDNAWLKRLQAMLQPLLRKNSIALSSDTGIKPGSKWKDEIERALATAKVAVLLVSPAFLASEFIARHELPPLLDRAKQRGLRILWVYVSACLYEGTGIAAYQAAHDIAQPLDRLRTAKRNEVLVQICQQIKAAVNPQEP